MLIVHHGAIKTPFGLVVNSERRQQRWHHPAAVMGDPGLLQELPDITALLPGAGGDGEQPAAADRTLAGLDAMTDLALNYGSGFLRQHCPVRDQRHLVLLAQMVAGLLLSETVCLDCWKTRLPLAHCLAASWQRRCQRWLANSRIDVEALYGLLVLWAVQHWQKPGHTLHLALDATMLWNRFCVLVWFRHGARLGLSRGCPSAAGDAEPMITSNALELFFWHLHLNILKPLS